VNLCNNTKSDIRVYKLATADTHTQTVGIAFTLLSEIYMSLPKRLFYCNIINSIRTPKLATIAKKYKLKYITRNE